MSVNSSEAGKRTTRTLSRRTSGTKHTDNQAPDKISQKTDKGTDMSKTTQAGQSGKEESAENTAPTQIQVANMAMIMPNRPIEHSTLEVTGTLMGNRPIVKADSALSVTLIQPEETTGVMANRPISATHIQITGMMMNRPIASNQIDDPNTLMGFID
jgi:hypothetical protein